MVEEQQDRNHKHTATIEWLIQTIYYLERLSQSPGLNLTEKVW